MSESHDDDRDQHSETDLAIVGMSGRFPGAEDVDTLWRRVVGGDDCLLDLDPERLVEAGLPRETVEDPNYVLRAGNLHDVDRFDHEFFGIGPRDASLMDPQHRVFLECAWEAIESAAHVPEHFDGAIGVFAGCGANTYLLNNLMTNPSLVEDVGWFMLRHTSNDKDFLPTFVSYKLDLHGPSISVQTACSTSLVAMHLAAQSLLSFECDMAVAGGVTIEVPHGVGYRYQEGEILSADGRCRAFDATSNGTVLSSGAGAVVLRRLADALDEGDPILAIMKSSAVNNDGARKVSFLAPSVDGHADVVKEALAVAGLSARDIGLVDAHGTGTAVGDPIEFAALTEAFRASTNDRGFCQLTSTKPNIGHLDTAAGVASVIKVVQALRHRQLPPLANFLSPSPLLEVEESPFKLSAERMEWPDDRTRRAGVSSLGVGGTNAHVIVQEAPSTAESQPSEPEQVLVLSARTDAALDDAARKLAGHLESEPSIELADVAHTLAVGRRAFARRRIVTATDLDLAGHQLVAGDRRRQTDATAPEHPPRLVFTFPGGGSQYAGMGVGLDARFDVYHDALSDGIHRVGRAGGPDLASAMAVGADPAQLQQADVSLPAVFVTSVALARQWLAWGARPDALLGHSLGEYVAAHISGVLSLDDAIHLVVTRSRLMAQAGGQRQAGMLAVTLPAEECEPLLTGDLSLAVVNTTGECVVAGPLTEVEALATRLETDDVHTSLLQLAAAAHSSILDPVLDEFEQVVRSVELSEPSMPYLSNLSGTWIEASQATDPRYWVDHLRGTVRFDRCLDTAVSDGPVVFAELGPGHALSSYARRHAPAPVAAIAALRHAEDHTPDTVHSMHAFATLWVHGIDVDVARFAGERRRRLRLPTYSFQRERHWIEPGGGTARHGVRNVAAGPVVEPLLRIDDVADWFWEPTWVPAETKTPTDQPGLTDWTVVADADDPLAIELRDELIGRGGSCDLQHHPLDVERIRTSAVCMFGSRQPERIATDDASQRWLSEALAAIRHLGVSSSPATAFAAITFGATTVSGSASRPVDAFALGPVRVAPKEYPSLRTGMIDLDPSEPPVASDIADELMNIRNDVVAVRGGDALVPDVLRRKIEEPSDQAATFIDNGVYLITGGLGDIGFHLASHLANAHNARLIVTSLSELPVAADRERWLAAHGSDDPTSRRIRRLHDLESAAEVIHVCADVSNRRDVQRAIKDAIQRFGRIDGAIHGAGRLRDALIELSTDADHEAVVGAKATGAALLIDELTRHDVDFVMLMSSTSSLLAAQGQVSYVAANAFLDALPTADESSMRVVTVNFGAWSGTGMAASAARRLRLELVEGELLTHPILTRRAEVGNGATEFSGQLATADDWVVDEHRTADGTAVFPGTGHVEMFLAAARLSGRSSVELADVLLVEPLVVVSDAEVTVKVRLDSPDDEGNRLGTIWSDGGRGVDWTLHAQATIRSGTSSPAAIDASDASFDAPIGNERLATQRSTLQLGPRWDAVLRTASSARHARADLELRSDIATEATMWAAHPALVDVAIGIAIALRDDETGNVFAPVSIAGATSFSSLSRSLSATVALSESTDDSITVDIDLIDSDGAPALMLRGVTLRDIGSGSVLSAVSPTPRPTRALASAGRFIELAETKGIRAGDAPTIIERIVGSGLRRLVVSSVDLSQLSVADAFDDEGDVASSADPVVEGVGLESTLQAIWSDLLGTRPDTDENFFELGGHSLIAIRLVARIHRELGVKIQLGALFDAPTVADLAQLLRAEHPDLDTQRAGDAAPHIQGSGSVGAPRTHLTLNALGDRTPLTVVHGAGGNVFFLSQLAQLMREHRPLNGIQAVGISRGDAPDASIERMAERYVHDVSSRSAGPHLLGGFSGGEIIALEMARQLQAAGQEVLEVVLFDSVPAGTIELPKWTSRKNVLQNVFRHGWGPTSSYLKNRFGGRLIEIFTDEQNDAPVPWLAELDAQGLVDLSDHFARISLDYRMPHYEVDAILVKADLMWPYQPYDYHWSPYIKGSLTTITAPGSHETMFDPPHVEAVWERLRPLLDRHDA